MRAALHHIRLLHHPHLQTTTSAPTSNKNQRPPPARHPAAARARGVVLRGVGEDFEFVAYVQDAPFDLGKPVRPRQKRRAAFATCEQRPRHIVIRRTRAITRTLPRTQLQPWEPAHCFTLDGRRPGLSGTGTSPFAGGIDATLDDAKAPAKRSRGVRLLNEASSLKLISSKRVANESCLLLPEGETIIA